MPDDAARLHAIWRSAVEATHRFVASADLAAIDWQVANDYLPNADLLVALDERGEPLAFMGLTGAHIDALFVHRSRHGQGIGRLLVDHAKRLHRALSVDVNEQNEGAIGFYERLGFRRFGRSARDGAGRPYPLLHLSMADGRTYSSPEKA